MSPQVKSLSAGILSVVFHRAGGRLTGIGVHIRLIRLIHLIQTAFRRRGAGGFSGFPSHAYTFRGIILAVYGGAVIRRVAHRPVNVVGHCLRRFPAAASLGIIIVHIFLLYR